MFSNITRYKIELRKQLKLFLPVLLTQIAQTSFSFVDTVMTGRVSATDMAAVALSASLWLPILLFGQGVLLAVTPAVAQLRGKARERRIQQNSTQHTSLRTDSVLHIEPIIHKHTESEHASDHKQHPSVVIEQSTTEASSFSVQHKTAEETLEDAWSIIRQGFWLALLISIPLLSIVYVLSFRLEQLGVTPDLAEIAGPYLRMMIWGGPGYLLYVALRSGMEGFACVRPALFAAFIGMFVNIPLNAIFIFGLYGVPQMGGVGAGVATALTNWTMFLVLVFYAIAMADFRQGLHYKKWEYPSLLRLGRLVRVGLPGALAMLFEVGLFSVVALLLAPLGAIQVAGHQVALNVSSIIFMLPFSIAIAATIRIGYGLGKQNPENVRLSARVTLSFALFIGVLSALFTIWLRTPIALMYNDNPAVTTLASALLLWAAVYQVTDAIQVSCVGILRGYNDTKAISITCFVIYWLLSLPLGYTLARTDLWGVTLGPTGFWIGFVVAVTLTAVIFLIRLCVLERRLVAGTLRLPAVD